MIGRGLSRATAISGVTVMADLHFVFTILQSELVNSNSVANVPAASNLLIVSRL